MVHKGNTGLPEFGQRAFADAPLLYCFVLRSGRFSPECHKPQMKSIAWYGHSV